MRYYSWVIVHRNLDSPDFALFINLSKAFGSETFDSSEQKTRQFEALYS